MMFAKPADATRFVKASHTKTTSQLCGGPSKKITHNLENFECYMAVLLVVVFFC